jgi:hypothetical protein
MKPQCLSGCHRSSVKLALAVIVLPVLLLTGSSRAQDIYAYPAKGQNQSQQDRDRYECHSWAVKQTGFDPSRTQASAPSPPPSNQPLPPQGHVVRGAARGSALGAVGGAITGNAGKGAAAGAAMGGLAGGMRRRDHKDPAESAAAGQCSIGGQLSAKPTRVLPSRDGGLPYRTRLHSELRASTLARSRSHARQFGLRIIPVRQE